MQDAVCADVSFQAEVLHGEVLNNVAMGILAESTV
jgi:hypothetical protein